MVELSMHILDVAQNSLAAGSTKVEINIQENIPGNLLLIEINDNGRGISREGLTRVTDPFQTSRKTREVGLGLPLLKEAAERCGGHLEVISEEGHGTKVIARFQLDHIDRAPLGDMGGTMGVLIAGNPEIDFLYEHRVNNQKYSLDTTEMRKVLGSFTLDDPSILDFVQKDIQIGLRGIGAAGFPKIMEVLK